MDYTGACGNGLKLQWAAIATRQNDFTTAASKICN